MGCTEPSDWKLLEDEDLREMGFGKFHIRKFRQKSQDYLNENSIISMQEQRLLREICMKPETWQNFEEEQGKAVREGLCVISPLLSEFFTRIHQGIKQSQLMLNYEANLNNDQLKAIEEIASAPPMSIEYKDENNEDDED